MPHPTEPASPDCHVYVGSDYLDKLPSLNETQQQEQARVVEDYVSCAVSLYVCDCGRGVRVAGWT